ncbi:MAG: transcription-repair coupling factor [Pseudomonadota bacterium]
MTSSQYQNPLSPPPLKGPNDRVRWGRLYGSSDGLVVSNLLRARDQLIVLITEDTPGAVRLEHELRFYTGNDPQLPILHFPDWETLPYDVFSPHQDIVSERLSTLYRLPQVRRGILIVPVATLMHRLPPRDYLAASSLMLDVGDRLMIDEFRTQLDASGYRCVSQVMEHGEFAVRGSLVDIFPMGSRVPYRIDLFDDEVESLRTFDPETQRTVENVPQIRLLPAREFPISEAGIKQFREAYRTLIEGDPQRSLIYTEVSKGHTPPGIEYYLPLFFPRTDTLLDYLPAEAVVCLNDDIHGAAEHFWQDAHNRYEQRRHDIERPLLAPPHLFLRVDELFERFKHHAQIKLQRFELEESAGHHNFATARPPSLTFDARAARPAKALVDFLASFSGRVLFAAESAGRRESLLDLLKHQEIFPQPYASWSEFLAGDQRFGITIAPLEHGLLLDDSGIAVIAESQLFGEQVLQRRRRKPRGKEAENIIRNLAELEIGAPVVHIDHGVGRYLGLQKITAGGMENEFLMLEYQDHDKLYVPVSSLHLISRYSGAAPENAPLHKLGSGQWEKAKRKAKEKIRDVAAELLAIYAQRELRSGFVYRTQLEEYQAFAAAFPFEETPDQEQAIKDVIADMASGHPMDRLICGDVGFGKTEVAMRAAFLAVQNGKQVAVLVPTTLLAQQHHQNFKDRFADWPVRIESLSRFRSKKETDQAIAGLESGAVDIVIGTHKLLQDNIKFNRLGLVIIDEEHRFGVRQKEAFKALRAEVDVLTLTATPIPRTLSMSLSGIRYLSIIATPPARRLSIKTFVSEWNDATVSEAVLREIKRGGQVYFLHNKVETIEKAAAKLEELIPEAKVRIAHGQMRERELEQVMSDFYHQRFNVLVCTTIIETGIDVPTANTIVIDRADHFGLAQLYQLRGRVGRSHHRAYAYLITPPKRSMTADAVKRIEALESIEELGTGFTLATHDMEIRGAGELLGEEQSGQMQEIGFSMYMELLERAVADLKAGRQIDLDRPLAHGTEVDLAVPALIPDDYLPDVNARLIMYKRIASAESPEDLRELQVEMIDRFGLLPDQAKNLFALTELKLKAQPLGIRKIEMGPGGGRLSFEPTPNIEPINIIRLIQRQSKTYQLDKEQRLRITAALPDVPARVNLLEGLLTELGRKDVA